jgi:hypothetical protein
MKIDGLSEKQKMLRGELYDATDRELVVERQPAGATVAGNQRACCAGKQIVRVSSKLLFPTLSIHLHSCQGGWTESHYYSKQPGRLPVFLSGSAMTQTPAGLSFSIGVFTRTKPSATGKSLPA